MDLSLGRSAVLLLLVAAVVAVMTRRFRLSYTAGLVAAGMALALMPWAPKVAFTKDFIFAALLPPLLFEAALHIRWSELRRDAALILTLATLGVVIAGAVTAAGMHYAAHWPWTSAVVFGALIAATDPVAVLATFRESRVGGRLRLLVDAESLFNDGTAAVAFGVAVLIAGGQTLSGGAVAWTLLEQTGGGIACGAVIAVAVLFLAGRTEDHLVELTFTTVAAYGSFLIADQLGCSGVFATITAGLILGNSGPGALSAQGSEAVDAFWEYAAFVANSLVFLLIGMQEATQNFLAAWAVSLIAIAAVLAGRAASVYPISLCFARTKLKIRMRHQHVLFWGGLRGALALALALGLPKELPDRPAMITVSFAVVAFSVFVQGLTMPRFLRRMGVIPVVQEISSHYPRPQAR